jgi:hypothetical protein
VRNYRIKWLAGKDSEVAMDCLQVLSQHFLEGEGKIIKKGKAVCLMATIQTRYLQNMEQEYYPLYKNFQ